MNVQQAFSPTPALPILSSQDYDRLTFQHHCLKSAMKGQLFAAPVVDPISILHHLWTKVCTGGV